jgi:hypothetical protein
MWHDGSDWKAFPIKAGRAKMIDRLRRFADVEFDVPLVGTRVDGRRRF